MVHPENPSFNPGWESDEAFPSAASRGWKGSLLHFQDRLATEALTLGRLWAGHMRAHPRPYISPIMTM